jgi:hypothetical protein
MKLKKSDQSLRYQGDTSKLTNIHVASVLEEGRKIGKYRPFKEIMAESFPHLVINTNVTF